MSSSEPSIYRCGGTSRFVGAGTFLYTRPARSNLEPWQGQKKPPGQPGSAPADRAGRKVGTQPRWVQMPTSTPISGLIARNGFLAYSGCCSARLDDGSLSKLSCCCRACSISGVRFSTHTGLPLHSSVASSPGRIAPTSTSTRSTQRTRAFTGRKRCHKGDRGTYRANAAGHRRRGEPKATGSVMGRVRFSHHRSPAPAFERCSSWAALTSSCALRMSAGHCDLIQERTAMISASVSTPWNAGIRDS